MRFRALSLGLAAVLAVGCSDQTTPTALNDDAGGVLSPVPSALGELRPATLGEARDALEALYNASNGPTWNTSTNWLTGSPCDWYGVVCSEDFGNKYVSHVQLSNNRLSDTSGIGPTQNSLPAALGKLHGLVVLDLSRNFLKGQIPSELGNLIDSTGTSGLCLGILDLSNNRLVGPVPLAVAKIGGACKTPQITCWLSDNRDGDDELFMPDLDEYRDLADGDGVLCNLFLKSVGQPPNASISSPDDGSRFEPGAQIDFAGSATDPEDGSLTENSLVWESSIDNQIGTGTSFGTSALSIGTHTIRLIATNSQGAADTAGISITVNANLPPSATISAPADDASFKQGDAVTFIGAATDPEDGPLTSSSLVWDSSRDGQIGTGESFSRGDLSAGTHKITLTATDLSGATGTATISITVNDPVSLLLEAREQLRNIFGREAPFRFVDVQVNKSFAAIVEGREWEARLRIWNLAMAIESWITCCISAEEAKYIILTFLRPAWDQQDFRDVPNSPEAADVFADVLIEAANSLKNIGGGTIITEEQFRSVVVPLDFARGAIRAGNQARTRELFVEVGNITVAPPWRSFRGIMPRESGYYHFVVTQAVRTANRPWN